MWLKCEVIDKSDDAMKILVETREVWMPKSCIYQQKKGFLDIVDWKYDQILEGLVE